MTKSNLKPDQDTMQWTKDELYQHLQMAIDVEFFTIPLYLTAASSIKTNARQSLKVTVHGEHQDGQPMHEDFPVYDTVFSVAVQEMYHLMWICNIAKSVGMTINIQAPDMTKLPATLNLPSSVTGKYKGPGNLADVIDLLVAIETPDSKYNYPVDPNDPITQYPGPTAPQPSYDSIGDLYHAIAFGLTELFHSLHDGSYDQYQKIMIDGSYPKVPLVTNLNNALNVIGAITEQGEGNGVDGFIPVAYEPMAGGFEDEDKYSHYERFVAIQQNIANITEYLYPTPGSGDPSNSDQIALTQGYSQLLDGINNSYTLAGSTLNTPGMNQVGSAIDNLWANGHLPMWTYKTPSVPVPLELHICQGLNSCAGHGAGRTGTGPGDGACATVNHTCASSNDCHGQGGCGLPGQAVVGGPQNVFTPGENACKGLSGCASPISVWQVFKDPGGPLDGKYVWCEARRLFLERMNSLNMAVKPVDPTPSAARQAPSTHNGTAPMKNNNDC